jgi:DnaJ-class molecular chaperone
MFINKIVCAQCHGKGHETVWRTGKMNQDGTGTIVSEEERCAQCKGKGYTTYPVFTVNEAVEVAKYFGFEINGLEDEEND